MYVNCQYIYSNVLTTNSCVSTLVTEAQYDVSIVYLTSAYFALVKLWPANSSLHLIIYILVLLHLAPLFLLYVALSSILHTGVSVLI